MNADASTGLDRRVAALVALFEHIAATRMHGVPILHPGLRVEAVGFAPVAGAAGAALGVLITPWFMNLLWLPAELAGATPAAGAAAAPPTAVGETRQRRVGQEVFPFIGAFEHRFGAYEACSLFSPMAEFLDHAAAVATAEAVLAELRREPEAPAPAQAMPAAPASVPSRRAMLLGRRAAGAAA